MLKIKLLITLLLLSLSINVYAAEKEEERRVVVLMFQTTKQMVYLIKIYKEDINFELLPNNEIWESDGRRNLKYIYIEGPSVVRFNDIVIKSTNDNLYINDEVIKSKNLVIDSNNEIRLDAVINHWEAPLSERVIKEKK